MTEKKNIPYFAKVIPMGNSLGITFDKKLRQRIKVERGIDLETNDFIYLDIKDIKKKEE